ncbi:MAG: cation:proton antiporter [Eubacteriales bacterium]|nr:cation:proton antiporter [Eubacteriales bacterium]
MFLTSIALILLIGLIFGKLAYKIGLPPLFGMLLAGIIIGPSVLNLLSDELLNIASELRQFALVVILCRAGLSLSHTDLKKIGKPAILMSFVPASVEIFAIVVIAPYLLGLSYLEAALLGAVLAAVSPAVIVPKMLNLMTANYGTKKGVPQLILAGASLDDIYVIVLFSTFLGLLSGGDFKPAALAAIPISIITGIALGLFVGYVLDWVFRIITLRNGERVIVLLATAFLLLTFEKYLAAYIPVSALLAIMSAGLMLRHRAPERAEKLANSHSQIWLAAEIILFVLVGAAVDLKAAPAYAGPGFILIALALFWRCLAVYLLLRISNFNRRERLFSAIAYTPKATVQAAIGAVPLAYGLACGQVILSLAVLAILVTAPLGAFAIELTYQRLLSRDEE